MMNVSCENQLFEFFPLSFLSVDRPDPLRLPEVMIVVCVLLLWCASILIFIRHSELLRIRHRDLPYRSSTKSPMNLNRITVVHRTSDMVIHSKPRFSAGNASTSTKYDQRIDDYNTSPTMFSSPRYSTRQERHTHSFDSNMSVTKQPHQHEQLLDPYMIYTDKRQRLLDLHRKSMENLSMTRYPMSYSTNDVSRHESHDENHLTVNERCVQESPV